MIHVKDTIEQVGELGMRIDRYKEIWSSNPVSRARDYLEHLVVPIAVASGDLKRIAGIADVDRTEIRRLSSDLEDLKRKYVGWFEDHVMVGEA